MTPASALKQPSLTNVASAAANSQQPVNTNDNPDWAGQIVPSDCIAAGLLFEQPIATYDEEQPLTFFSADRSPKPPGQDIFPIPYGAKYSTLNPRFGSFSFTLAS
ncbi:MAG: hypothetical protein Q9170_003918 [Blastenia crenularia]